MGLQSRIETARVSSALENGARRCVFLASLFLASLVAVVSGGMVHAQDPGISLVNETANVVERRQGGVLSPGVHCQGMNPFVIERGDSEKMLQRIGSLRRLIEVTVGQRLSADRRASLDHALAGYQAQPRGAHRLPRFLHVPLIRMLRVSRLLGPFATGSLRRDRVRPATGPMNRLI